MPRHLTHKQKVAAIKNLKKARQAKKRYALIRRGGFMPGALPLAIGALKEAHELAKKYRPVSAISDFGKKMGYKLPDGKFGNLLKKVGDFAINKLGYGRHRPHRRH